MTKFSAPMAFAMTLTLAACAGNSVFDRDPSITGMQMDGDTMPEASRVSIPMPTPQPARVNYRAEGASLWEHASGGFFADQRATGVGDILTIMIDINDTATLQNATSRSRSGSGNLGFPSFFGYGTQIDAVLPGVGPEDLPSGDIVDISSAQQSAGNGRINRREAISLKIAALVVQELPNGNFVVAGRQEVKVNQELRELRVAGIIRPQDIQMNNTISYEKIAEARITYGGRGELTRQQERGNGEDFLDIILPY